MILLGFNHFHDSAGRLWNVGGGGQLSMHPKVEREMGPTETLGPDLPGSEDALFKLEQFPVLDDRVLSHSIHEPQLIIELLNDFISEPTQDAIETLKKLHAQGDWDGVAKLAHKLKGGAAYLGTVKMQYACQYLERYYQAGHRKLLERLYVQLLQVNDETEVYLTQWLGKSICGR